MFSFSDVMHFFPYELASLRRWGLSFAFLFLGLPNSILFRHSGSFLSHGSGALEFFTPFMLVAEPRKHCDSDASLYALSLL